MGFQRAVVAALEPLEAECQFYKNWLGSGYAASMDYLQRHAEKRHNPRLLCPEAYSLVILSASYYTKVADDPGPEYGRIARYAVGLDYHQVIAARLEQFKAQVENKTGRPLLGKYFTDDVGLFELGLAARHGLGFIGKNSLLIGPQLAGSYHFVCEIFTDLPLEPDEPYKGTCGLCGRCRAQCPTSAIVSDKTVDARLCISFLTIENKGAIPVELRKKLGHRLFGCDACQEVCPYNQDPPETCWTEFSAQAGTGHYANLFDILSLSNKNQFMERFGRTSLSRAKRNGLIRNALVVMGNRLPEKGSSVLVDFIRKEENEMLLAHALWALSCYDRGATCLKSLYDTGTAIRHSQLKAFLDELP